MIAWFMHDAAISIIRYWKVLRQERFVAQKFRYDAAVERFICT
jgi:hypothetical protein